MPAIPVGSRVSRQRFVALKAEATAIFANSMALARDLGVPLILTSGASFRTRGDEVADETWPVYRGGLAAIGADTDPLIDEALRIGSPPLVLMMPGQIYGNGGMFRNFMYPMMKKGHSRVIGSGANYLPRIHVDDCAAACLEAVRRLPVGERLIIADDTPSTQREFTEFMAELMGLPRPGRIPALAVRLVMGDFLYKTVTMNSKVTNAKARRVLDGWRPAYPSYREGLRAAIAEIEAGHKAR